MRSSSPSALLGSAAFSTTSPGDVVRRSVRADESATSAYRRVSHAVWLVLPRGEGAHRAEGDDLLHRAAGTRGGAARVAAHAFPRRPFARGRGRDARGSTATG